MSIEAPTFTAQNEADKPVPTAAELRELMGDVAPTPTEAEAPAPLPTPESRITTFIRNRAENVNNLANKIDSGADKVQSLIETGQEKYTSARDKLRGFGRSALSLYKRGKQGAIDAYQNRDALILEGRARVEEGAENALNVTKQTAVDLKESALTYADATKQKIDLKVDDAKMWAQDKVEAGVEKVAQIKNSAEMTIMDVKMAYATRRNEVIGQVDRLKQAFIDKKNAALRRKMDRQERRGADRLTIEQRKEELRQVRKQKAGRAALSAV